MTYSMTPRSLGCLCANLTNLTTRKFVNALIFSLLEFIVISGSYMYNAPLASHLKGQGFLGYKFLSLCRAQATSYHIVAILTLKCSQKKVQNLHDLYQYVKKSHNAGFCAFFATALAAS